MQPQTSNPSIDIRYYNSYYFPVYSLKGTYLWPKGYYAPLHYKRPVRAGYGALLAPLVAGIVERIDLGPSYLDKNLDPILGMFREKSQFAKAGIESALHEIWSRYDLMKNSIEQIDYAICKTDTKCMELPDFILGINKDWDRVRTSLEADVLRLESQKRDEQTVAWKDITRIKSDLFETLESYLTAQSSSSFLNYQGGQNY